MTKLISDLAKGAWSGATAYTIGDIVDNDGSSYICIANSTNHEPPNATYWALLAQKGADGVGAISGGVENHIVSIDALSQAKDSGIPISSIPSKATGAEVDTGTDDAKFVTAKAMEDSSYAKTSAIPVKASGAEVNTGTDDAKFVTAKAMEDSDYVKVVSNDINLPAGGNLQINSTDPYRTIVLPASSMSPTATAGCASLTTYETTTNKNNIKYLAFDASTDEHAYISFRTPNNYDGGTLLVSFTWTAPSGSGDVIWGIAGRAFANDDAYDQALGTAVLVTDTLITAYDDHESAETAAVTIAGTPAGGQKIYLDIYRDANAAGDTLGVDAWLTDVSIRYKIKQYSD